MIDYYVEDQAEMKNITINNLLHENFDDYPFFSLNPRHMWTGGGQYWFKKLKKCIYKVSEKKKYEKGL